MGLISANILNDCMISPDAHVIVALSGGSDSVALLLSFEELLKEHRIRKLTAAHFNHCLRGDESEEDSAFCGNLCDSLGIDLKTASGDVSLYAEKAGIGIEEAARVLRYRFLRNVRETLNADCIALGHHADDQLETILMHLIRGSGLKGLGGMQKRNGDLVRPFLGITKREILAYLKEKEQPYRMDSSNTEICFERNKVRMELLPQMETIRPDVAKRVARMAEGLQRDEAFLEKHASAAMAKILTEDGGYDCEQLSMEEEPVRDRILLNILRENLCFDITGAQMERLKELTGKPSGREVPIKGNLWGRKDGNVLRIIRDTGDVFPETEIRPGETVRVPGWTVRLSWADTYRKPESELEAMLDAGLLGTEPVLKLRRKEDGDAFRPLGMPGKKLVSDIYTDRKMPERMRKAPLLEHNGEILFVPGYTISESMRITGNTSKILHIIFEEEQNGGQNDK